MNKFNTKSAQGGFTLIELIVVIVILGILAATALPKFASLGGDARIASLQAAKGAMTATASMVHGKWLIKPSDTKVNVEGTDVNITAGYPAATKNFALAAGLNETDYDIAVSGTTVTVTPISVATHTTLKTTCNLVYTEVVSPAVVPTYALAANTKCE